MACSYLSQKLCNVAISLAVTFPKNFEMWPFGFLFVFQKCGRFTRSYLSQKLWNVAILLAVIFPKMWPFHSQLLIPKTLKCGHFASSSRFPMLKAAAVATIWFGSPALNAVHPWTVAKMQMWCKCIAKYVNICAPLNVKYTKDFKLNYFWPV